MIIKEKYKTYLNHIILKPIDALPAVTIRLRPILFHIILKLTSLNTYLTTCLRPILFHIILKRRANQK